MPTKKELQRRLEAIENNLEAARDLIDETLGLEEEEDGAIPKLVIGRSQIVRILHIVRTIILDWTLKLEEQGILGENLRFSSKDKEVAVSITYNIGSFSGVLGNVTGDTVYVGDYTAIYKQLEEMGLSEDERNEIEEILEKTKDAQGEKKRDLVRRAGDWLRRNGPLIGNLSKTILELTTRKS